MDLNLKQIHSSLTALRVWIDGKLDAGESVLMIEHMEKTGKIEKTGEYNVYRMGKPVTT